MKQLQVLITVLVLLVWPGHSHAEEFFASVSVQAGQVANIDQEVFNQMQRDMQEYLNNTRFTDHVFLPEERIRMRVTIIINAAPSNDQFQGTATFQAKRTVYNSTYETLTYNFDDKHFNFRYVPFQPLQYSENAFVDNLTSLLNFHALMAIGFDYDSFKLEDGVPYFERARNVLNLAQASNERGWQAMDGQQTRYWMMENMLNNSYKALHNIYYLYHRQGLDVMSEDFLAGRTKILLALENLQSLFVNNPNIYLARVFLDAKRPELIQIMTSAFPEDKQRFIRMMQQLDPRNMDKYNAINNAQPGQAGAAGGAPGAMPGRPN